MSVKESHDRKKKQPKSKSISSFFEIFRNVKSSKRQATITEIDWQNVVFTFDNLKAQNQESKNWISRGLKTVKSAIFYFRKLLPM